MASDLDILVFYMGQKRDDAYGVVKKVLGIPRLEPHLYTEEEYKRMKGILSKIKEAGVVILSKGERGWKCKRDPRWPSSYSSGTPGAIRGIVWS